jgi:hypothetical protein
MRVLVLVAVAASIVVLTGWTTYGEGAIPRNCTTADTRQRAVLNIGVDSSGGPAYMRFCGPARAVVRVHGTSYRINGGICGDRSGPTRVYFGLIENGGRPGARGLSLVLQPGNVAGSFKIIDSIVQVAGLDLAPRGTAVVGDGRTSGTFAGEWKGTRVTGSWVCGAGAFGKPRFRHVSG